LFWEIKKKNKEVGKMVLKKEREKEKASRKEASCEDSGRLLLS
jgi:hypothetical protein